MYSIPILGIPIPIPGIPIPIPGIPTPIPGMPTLYQVYHFYGNEIGIEYSPKTFRKK